MQDIGKVGSIGGKTIAYYMCTTAFAVVLALILASVAKGAGLFAALNTSGLTYTPPEGQSIMTTISRESRGLRFRRFIGFPPKIKMPWFGRRTMTDCSGQPEPLWHDSAPLS